MPWKEGHRQFEAAPERRVGLFLHNTTADVMSETAWSMFDAAVAWCLRNGQSR